MLNGLEISEINLTEIKKIKTFRLDGDYFQKKYIGIQNIIRDKENVFVSFSNLNLKVDASAFYPSIEPYYNKGQIPFVRVADVNDFIDYKECVKIPQSLLERVEYSTLKMVKKGDVVITKGGSIGRVALIDRDTVVTRDLIFINSSQLNRYEYIFLYIYLNTKFCNNLIIQSSSMTAQPHLTLTLIKDIPIFNPSNSLKEKISNLFEKSIVDRDKAIIKYAQAEHLLISELGLEDFNPSRETVSIKTLKESFFKTGRLDSEYYQPKYDDYLKKMFSYSNGYELLGKCCNIKDKNFMPKDDEEYRYIELANVRGNAELSDCEVLLGKELPTRARRKVNMGDVIVSSIEGSLESCALITEEYDNALCSTGFYVVNSDKLNSESLLTVFKSSLMLNLMKKGCSGTILTNISKDEFVELPIPILKKEIQDEIASYIKQSMEYSKRAKKLLEISTKAVEIAIDKDEQVAHNFLASSQQPAASSQQPAASSQQPAASSQQPAASSQQPAASSQQPAASSQQLTMRNKRAPISDLRSLDFTKKSACLMISNPSTIPLKISGTLLLSAEDLTVNIIKKNMTACLKSYRLTSAINYQILLQSKSRLSREVKVIRQKAYHL